MANMQSQSSKQTQKKSGRGSNLTREDRAKGGRNSHSNQYTKNKSKNS